MWSPPVGAYKLNFDTTTGWKLGIFWGWGPVASSLVIESNSLCVVSWAVGKHNALWTMSILLDEVEIIVEDFHILFVHINFGADVDIDVICCSGSLSISRFSQYVLQPAFWSCLRISSPPLIRNFIELMCILTLSLSRKNVPQFVFQESVSFALSFFLGLSRFMVIVAVNGLLLLMSCLSCYWLLASHQIVTLGFINIFFTVKINCHSKFLKKIMFIYGCD